MNLAMPIENLEMTSSVDFTKKSSQILLILSVKIALLFIVFLFFLLLPLFQNDFYNLESQSGVFLWLSLNFLADLGFLLFFERLQKSTKTLAALFIIDTLITTGLIFQSGIPHSFFLLLYILNITLCGFIFLRAGAVRLALLTSIFFGFALTMGTDLKGSTFYFSLLINNLAFISVALLSGHLSEQMNFMGVELRARRRDLKVLQNLYESIVQNIGTGLLTVNEDFEILQVNKSGAKILDLEEDELVGNLLQKKIPEFYKLIGELTHQTNFKTIYHDIQYDLGADRKAIFSVSATPLEDEVHEVQGYVLTFQDQTQVRRLEESMRQSEKLAAVGQLAAGIAHEIRNPLASISGSIQMLETMIIDRPDEQKLMKITLREIDRLNNMITEFLDFVRPDKMELKPVDINQLMREVMSMAQVNTKLRRDTLQVCEIEGSEWIMGDVSKLKQALLNIVINAYQAMENSPEPRLQVKSSIENGELHIVVADTGCGMDSKTIKRIFEPFLTTKPKGTGLGLAVTHKILESHHAKVFVESAIGAGTKFTLVFPLVSKSELPKIAVAN